MSQNPNDPNYNPYGSNPSYPNPGYPGTPPPGTAYGPQTPSRADPNTPSQAGYGSGSYDNPYAPPPPPSGPYNIPPIPATPSNPYDPYAPTVQNQPVSSPGYPAYNPSSGMPSAPSPLQPPQPAPEQKKRGRGGIVILAVVALLIIAAGIIGFVAYNSNQNTLHANATATAQANGTAQANANSTATVQTGANATATASAVANTYPFSTNLVLNDPLSGQDSNNWDNDGKFCFFSGSAYHVFDNQTNTYQTCASTKANFTNFTMQVEMLIKTGNTNSGGGLIFRGDEANSKYYRLFIDSQGNYGLLVSVDTTGSSGNARILTTGTASQFTQGTGQTNTIAVSVRGDQISFFIGGQQITTVTDSTYTHGQIGFTADDQNANTEVVYTNLKVWQRA